MIKFNVDINEDIFNSAKEEIKNKYRRVLMKSMFKMEELAVKDAPFDRGTLKGGITLFPQMLADKYILKSNSPNSAVMEYGSRPFYAPIKPLKAWARRKLGDENIGYAVRAKIAEVGITAQPYMRPALHQTKIYWVPIYMKEEYDN